MCTERNVMVYFNSSDKMRNIFYQLVTQVYSEKENPVPSNHKAAVAQRWSIRTANQKVKGSTAVGRTRIELFVNLLQNVSLFLRKLFLSFLHASEDTLMWKNLKQIQSSSQEMSWAF